MKSWVRLHENDHVIIALRPFLKGEQLSLEEHADGEVLELLEDVPMGHKVLTRLVKKGEHVLKFGYSIGKAQHDIAPGSWVHTHNLSTGLKGVLSYTYESDPTPLEKKNGSAESVRTFQGFIRENGEVGIRNEIWIINTVGCINKTCEIVAKRANEIFKERVDGVHHFAHPFGCSQLGDDLVYTQKLLASLVQHPNAGGVLVIGLGCENNQIEDFKRAIGDYNPDRIKFFISQEAENEIEQGLALIQELVEYAEQFKRSPVPISMLKLGLKCGGSDGLSGITANPLVGAVSDYLIGAGGTAILTEVPEMFGAETILMNRAADKLVFEKIVSLINDFKQYFIKHNQEIYENPSPGNKAGGISTLEEKSLGCTQKGGHAIIRDVVPYGQRVTSSGLNLLEAPGNDMVSVTALAASGAHMVLFTTGRGTPYGGPVPTVKIATNSELASRKKTWIDFNAGQLIEGKDMKTLEHELREQLISLASGETRAHNERNGYKEIAIFKDGVIL